MNSLEPSNPLSQQPPAIGSADSNPLSPLPKKKPVPPIPTGRGKGDSPEVARATDQTAESALSSMQGDQVRPTNPPRAKPPKVLGRSELLALKLWASVSPVGKQKYEDYVNKHLDYRRQVSTEHAKELLAKPAYVPDVNKAGLYLKIDIALPADVKRTPFVAHTAAAERAFTEGAPLYQEVPEKDVSDIGTLKPYGFDADSGQVKEGVIVPTSHWLGNPVEVEHNHMMNFYIIRPTGEKTAVIRSAKIDTKQKADELVAQLKRLCDEIRQETGDGNYQLRVVSEQLNSFDFGRESQMIEDQHTWLADANAELRREGYGELVHISTPTNVWYFLTQKVRKLGIFGKLLEKHAFNGEMRSKELNLDSWGTYVKWTNEKIQVNSLTIGCAQLKAADGRTVQGIVDEYQRAAAFNSQQVAELQGKVENLLAERQRHTDKLPALKAELQKARQQAPSETWQAEVAAATKALDEAKAARRALRQDIKSTRVQLREKLVQQHQQLTHLENQLQAVYDHNQKGDPALLKELESFRKPAYLMCQLLGSQLDIPTASSWSAQRPVKSSRHREILLLQAVHDELGVTSAGNCKSGLDRTGMWHAAVLALKQLRKSAGVDTFKMTDEWDTATRAMNVKIDVMGPELFAEWLMEEGDETGDPAEKQLYREIVEFRKMVLDNLMTIGLPMTERSTGLQGFKWSPGGIGENMMPLNFLPSHAIVEEKLVPLVKYGKHGQVRGLTSEGVRVLAKFEDMRAS